MADSDCVFCRIAAGKAPAHRVYEDSDFVAFLSIEPKTVGHCVLIPKEHHRWTYEVPEFGKYWEVARRVGLAARDAMGASWVSFLTLGNEIRHAHIWIMPRGFSGDRHRSFIDFSIVEVLSPEELSKVAEKIRANLR